MKTKIKYVIVLLLFPIILVSQNSFEFVFEDTISAWCYSTFIDSEDFFVTIGKSVNPDNQNRSGLFLKYKDGTDIIVNKLSKPDTFAIIKFGFELGNGNYLFLGLIDDNDDPYYKNLYILETDNGFGTVNEKIYGIPDQYNALGIYNYHVNADGSVIIYGHVDDPAPGFINDIYIAKLNEGHELVGTTITPDFYGDVGSEMLKKPDNSGYYLIGGFGYAELIEIDNDINIVGYQWMDPDNDYHGHLGVRWLSDGNIIIASQANQEVPGAFYDLRVRLCDTDLVAYKDTVIFEDGKNRLPIHSGLDFIDENNIWVVTDAQEGKSEYGKIYIFDAGLNVKGAKYFGGFVPKYLYSIKALPDGGCIITGTTPKDGKNGEKSDKNVYIKKVMPFDILTHAEETLDEDDCDVLLYPVPFDRELKIETYRENLSFSMFSVSGECVVLRQQLTIPNTSIKTPNIGKGAYFYSIYDNGQIIQSGKIIKN